MIFSKLVPAAIIPVTPNTALLRSFSRRAIIGVLLVSILLTFTIATAGDRQGRYAIKGAGAENCSTYTAIRKANKPETYMYMGWLQGWLSNENRHSKETFELASWQHTATLLAAMNAYCNDNPERPFVTGAEALITSMRADRLKTSSLQVNAEADGRSVSLYATTLRRLQEQLHKLDFLKSQPDGLFGSTTRDAIRSYQAQHGMKQTGLPDQAVLQQLVYSSTGKER